LTFPEVAGSQDFAYLGRFRRPLAFDGLVGHAVMMGGVKRLAHGVDPLEAFLGKYVEEGAGHLLHVLTAAVGQCQVGRVQNGQELFYQRGSRVFDDLALLALDAFAVIVELGLQPEQSIQVLITLAGHIARPVVNRRRSCCPSGPTGLARLAEPDAVPAGLRPFLAGVRLYGQFLCPRPAGGAGPGFAANIWLAKIWLAKIWLAKIWLVKLWPAKLWPAKLWLAGLWPGRSTGRRVMAALVSFVAH
jgi:hypothetical protein